jgi:hypothetical protein
MGLVMTWKYLEHRVSHKIRKVRAVTIRIDDDVGRDILDLLHVHLDSLEPSGDLQFLFAWLSSTTSHGGRGDDEGAG